MKFFPKTKKIDKEENKDKESVTPKEDESTTLQKEKDTKPDGSLKSTNNPKKGLFGFAGGLAKKQKDSKDSQIPTFVKDVETIKLQSREKHIADEEKISLDTQPKMRQSESNAIEGINPEKASKLIEIIAATKENTVTPVINFEENKISYPLLEQIGEDENNISLLEKLSSAEFGILEKEVYDRLLVCPEHKEFFAVTLRLYCSSCNSLDLIKLQLLEHKTCGFIAERKEFGISSDNDVITKCLGCEKTIRDMQKEIRKLGMWYQCNGCKTKLDNPVMKLRCRKFDHDFDINQSGTVIIPCYKPKKESKTIHNYLVSLIPQIKKLLVSYGLTVHDSSSVRGKSGVSHQISVFADNQKGNTIIIDAKGAETEIEDSVMDSMLSKALDLSPSIAILIAVPSISDRAKAMATGLNISVITGQNFADIIAQVEEILKNHLARTDLPKI